MVDSSKQTGAPLSTVTTHLIWLCMLPLILLAAGMGVYEVTSIHRQQEEHAVHSAENFSATIDHALSARIDALSVLAQSPLLDESSGWRDFHREAQGFYRSFGTHVVITDGGAPTRMLLNTRVPYGTELPVVPKPQGRLAGRIALQTGKPAVSDLFHGPIADELLLGIAVPVIREGNVRFIVLTTLERSFFQKLIDRVVLPTGWSIVLRDAVGDPIASNAASPDTPVAVRSESKSEVSNWTATVEIPTGAYWWPMAAAAAALGAAIIGVTLAGLLGGKRLGKHIGEAVVSLTEPTASGARPRSIREIAAVRVRLDEEAERRRTAEAILRESEGRLRSFIEHAPAALAMFDRQMRYLSVSRRWRADYCLGEQAIIGRSHYDVFPEIPENWKDVHRRGMNGETIEAEEDRFTRLNGAVQWLHWVVHPWYSAKGDIGGILIFSEDVTERKNAEETLHRYELLAQHSRDIVLFMNASDGRLLEANAAAVAAYGYNRDELLNLTIHDLRAADTRNLTAEQMAKAATRSIQFETVHRCKDGSTFPVEVSSQGAVIGGTHTLINVVRNIRERKQAETELKQAEERLRLALDGAALGTWDWNIATGEAVLNRRWGEMLGYRPGELEHHIRTWEALLCPDDTPRVMEKVKDHLEGKTAFYETEHRLKHKSGDWIWVLDRGRVIERDAQGKAVRACGTHLDITERKNAERVLEEESTRRRVLFEQSPDGIVIIDPKTARFIDFNTAAHEMLGYSREEFATLTLFDVEVRETPEDTKARIAGVIRDGRADFETRQRTRQGAVRSVYVTAQFVKLAGAHVYHCIWRDITERKLAETETVESEERNRKLIEASADAILVRSMGIINYANPAAVKLFRAESEKDLIGKSYLDLVHPDDRLESAERVRRNIEEGWIAPPREHRILTLDGQVAEVESTGVPVKYKGEHQTFGIFRDITERKKAYEEKAKLESQLQQAQKMESLGTLAGGIAHDFNNILGVIIGCSEMLEISNAVEAASQGTLNSIITASTRAKDLVRQILAFSRHAKQEKILLNLKPVVRETFEFLRASIPVTIQLRQQVDPQINTIIADPTQMQQVLMNLCTNAVHAMEYTGGVLDVGLSNVTLGPDDVRSFPDLDAGEYVRLSVTDTGHGIAPGDMPKIFDPYFTTKEPGKGTGLGLSVVHGIVKAHGGSIKVYSEAEKGSSFQVFLPSAEGSASSEPRAPQALRGGKERILLVDDEAALADIEKQMLTWLGYEVEVRTSPIEALEAFKANPRKFDLVLTDLSMPQMTGMKLPKEMVQIRSDTPIILCTGFSDQVEERKAASLGIKSFLFKPLVANELAEAIRKALGK